MKPCDALSLPLAGTTVIEASAGTGKTYTITTLVLRLLLEQDLTIEQILVVTYTRAATAELRDRIRRRLTVALRRFQGEGVNDVEVNALYTRAEAHSLTRRYTERLDRALSSLDEAPVLTIHGFCQRVLSDHAFDSGSSLDATLSNDDGPLLDEIAQDYYARALCDGREPEVAAVRDITPDKLRRLSVRAGQGLGIKLVPEVDPVDLSSEAWFAQRDACAALWSRDREIIVGCVQSLPRVSSKNLLSWAEQMDALLEGGRPGFSSDKFATGFGYFTRSGYEAKRGPKTLLAHPFSDAAQTLLGLDDAYVSAEQNAVVAFRRGFLDYADTERQKRAGQRNERTFDALLTDLDRALTSERGSSLASLLRIRFRAALVDEFQDTDPLQYRIFRTLFGSETLPLLLIGDPKQAIYGFRGADVFAYLRARADAGEHVYTLNVNRRSDAELVSAMNALYARVEKPFIMPGIDYHAVSVPEAARARFRSSGKRAPIELLLIDGAPKLETLRIEIARGVAGEIATLLSSGATRLEDGPDKEPRHRPLLARDVAVLCRTNNEAKIMQRYLTERGVPSVLQGDASVFESEDADEIERVLLSLSNPSDARAMRSMLCSIYGGLDAAQLRLLESDDERWDEHRARLHDVAEILTHRGFAQAMRTWARVYDVERNLLRRPDGPRRITNLWHLLELLSEVATSQRLHALGVLRVLRMLRSDASLRGELVGEAQQLRLESSENAALLTTIHKSKGLEYPIVYVPFAWDGQLLRPDDKELLRFHDATPEHVYTLDLGSTDKKTHQTIAEQEALAEGLRLIYVALTRAKHRVSVVVPTGQSTSFASSPLAYLLAGGGERTLVAERLKALTPADLHSLLAGANADTQVTWSTSTLNPRATTSITSLTGAGSTRRLEARNILRAFDKTPRTASFSSLIAGASKQRPQDYAADRDALTGGAQTDEEQAAPSSLVLDAFPRGAVAGQLMHEVLEHHDFRGEERELRELVARAIVARGYDASLVDMLTRGLAEVLCTPLEASGLRLSDIGMDQRISEMEFVFPVKSELSSRALERAFRAHLPQELSATVLGSLRGLSFESLQGFLRGYIDLVFEHSGRFYIADYKSNRLGPRVEDYGYARMSDEMAHHQYFLQYHLYVLALHRHLSHRVRGYDYERHMGGAYYLFLRGMAEQHPLGNGVFFDRPSFALVQELDALMSGLAAREALP